MTDALDQSQLTILDFLRGPTQIPIQDFVMQIALLRASASPMMRMRSMRLTEVSFGVALEVGRAEQPVRTGFTELPR